MKESQNISKSIRRLHFMQVNYSAGKRVYARTQVTSVAHTV